MSLDHSVDQLSKLPLYSEHQLSTLCLNENRYGRDCCNGALMEQGIGRIQAAAKFAERGGFSVGFSDGFDIGEVVF